MFNIVTSNPFNYIIVALIVINTIIMASEHYKMASSHELFIEYSNVVLTSLFGLEMVMKLLGLGFRGYISDKMNIFDGLLVIVGLIDIIVL